MSATTHPSEADDVSGELEEHAFGAPTRRADQTTFDPDDPTDDPAASESVVTETGGALSVLRRGLATSPELRKGFRITVVMALVGCARAGGRTLSFEDREWIRSRFVDGHPLDVAGLAWLDRWLGELAGADLGRLSAEKVAERVGSRLDDEAAGQVLVWLMHGARAAWPGPGGEQYIAELAAGLGLAAHLDGLWAKVAREPDPVAVIKAAAILGIPVGTTPEEARRAYRALVTRWHPDRARTALEAEAYTRRTAAINAAWAILSAG